MTTPAWSVHPLSFDRIVVTSGGVSKTFDVEGFLALPFAERIRHILAGELEFFRGAEPRDRTRSLVELRERASQAL